MNKELHFHRDSDRYDYVAKAKEIKYGIFKAYNDTWCAYTDDFEEVKHWIAVHYPRSDAKSKTPNSIDYKDINRLKIGFKIVKKMPKTKSIHLENIKCVTRSRDYNGRLEYTVYYDTVSGISKHITVKPSSFSK